MSKTTKVLELGGQDLTYVAHSCRCIKCGGDMIGDGHTSVTHCEYAEESSYECVEPDGGPIYCNFED